MGQHGLLEGNGTLVDPQDETNCIDVSTMRSDEEYRDLCFDGMDLRNLDLDSCRFVDCSFVGSNLTNTHLNAAVFVSCQLSGAQIAGCTLFSARFEHCKLLGLDYRDGLNLTGTVFDQCQMDYSTFRGVSLKGVRFERCRLVEADLSLTNLELASLVNCDVTGVDIQEATFHQTDLRGAYLTGWNLCRLRRIAS